MPAAANAIPTIAGVQALVPGAETALDELPGRRAGGHAGGRVADPGAAADHPDPGRAAAVRPRRRRRASSTASAARRRRLRRQRPLPQGELTLQGGGSIAERAAQPARAACTGTLGPVPRRAQRPARAVPGRRHARRPPTASNPWTTPDTPGRAPATSATRRTISNETARRDRASLLGAVAAAVALVFGAHRPGQLERARFDVIFDDARGLVGRAARQGRRRAGGHDRRTSPSPRTSRRGSRPSIDSQFMPFRPGRDVHDPPRGPDRRELRRVRSRAAAGSPPLTGRAAASRRRCRSPNTTEPVSLLDLFNIFNLPTQRAVDRADQRARDRAPPARGQDLNDILRRANPALALARQVIGILDRQRLAAGDDRRRDQHDRRRRRRRTPPTCRTSSTGRPR